MGTAILNEFGRPFVLNGVSDGTALPHALTFAQLYGSIWRTYYHKADEAMRDDPESARAMRNDAHLMGILNERYYAVCNARWHIHVENEKDPTQSNVKKLVTAAVEKTPRLRKLFWAANEGVFYGKAGAIRRWKWEHLPLETGKGKTWFKMLTTEKWSPVNGDKIGFTYDGTPYILVHTGQAMQMPGAEFYDWQRQERVPQKTVDEATRRPEIIGTLGGNSWGLLMKGDWRQRLLLHKHQMLDEDFWDSRGAGGVHGIGVRQFVYHTWWMRSEWLANISDFMARAGMGLTVWYYSAGNPESLKAAKAAAKDQSDKVNLFVPRADGTARNAGPGVERVEVPVAGAEMLRVLVEYMDAHIERFVIGQTLSGSTEGSGLGGTGVASMHADTKQQIVRWDSWSLEETLTEEVVKPIVSWSVPWADFPVMFRFDLDEPDPKERMDAIKAFIDLGGEVLEDEARPMGLSKPVPGDVVLGGGNQMGGPLDEPGAAPPQGEEAGGGKPGEPRPQIGPRGGRQLVAASGKIRYGMSAKTPAAYSRDPSGHEHKGKGEGGGQFTGPGQGGASSGPAPAHVKRGPSVAGSAQPHLHGLAEATHGKIAKAPDRAAVAEHAKQAHKEARSHPGIKAVRGEALAAAKKVISGMPKPRWGGAMAETKGVIKEAAKEFADGIKGYVDDHHEELLMASEREKRPQLLEHAASLPGVLDAAWEDASAGLKETLRDALVSDWSEKVYDLIMAAPSVPEAREQVKRMTGEDIDPGAAMELWEYAGDPLQAWAETKAMPAVAPLLKEIHRAFNGIEPEE